MDRSETKDVASSRIAALATYRRLYRWKIKLYRELYLFTNDQCGFCISSGCACKDRICLHVEEQAKKRGISFQHTGHALRFIGTKGCIVPPHLRETCTIYLCEKAQTKAGFNAAKYAKLKNICSKIDWRLMELEDAHTGLALEAGDPIFFSRI